MSIKAKKIPYYLFISVLTLGTSLTFGLLSFSGGMALWPFIGVGIVFFGLSVAYEGQIYLKNIRGALQKIIKQNYVKERVAKEFILESFQNSEGKPLPDFLNDYALLLKQLAHANESHSQTGAVQKKHIKKQLKEMERVFAGLLFADEKPNLEATDYERSLTSWLGANAGESLLKKYKKRTAYYRIAGVFSAVSGLVMGVGTTYLLTSALLSVGFLASLPLSMLTAIVITGAVFSALGYTMLAFNALTDMINNDTLNKWYGKIKNDLLTDLGPRSVFMAVMAVFLVLLAVGLTVCTAGTWWSIVKETPRLFFWMKGIAHTVTAAFASVFLGVSSLIFGLENSAESLEAVNDIAKDPKGAVLGLLQETVQEMKKAWQNESWTQRLNPFRLLLKITYTPLRILLFLGHLLSMAVIADRLPGVPAVVSSLLGFLEEGFTDVNYFFETTETAKTLSDTQRVEQHLNGEHGHNHGSDIPSVALKVAFTWLLLPAALWHFLGSGSFTKESVKKSWDMFFGSDHHAHSADTNMDASRKVSPELLKMLVLSTAARLPQTDAMQTFTKAVKSNDAQALDQTLADHKKSIDSIAHAQLSIFARPSVSLPERVCAVAQP